MEVYGGASPPTLAPLVCAVVPASTTLANVVELTSRCAALVRTIAQATAKIGSGGSPSPEPGVDGCVNRALKTLELEVSSEVKNLVSSANLWKVSGEQLGAYALILEAEASLAGHHRVAPTFPAETWPASSAAVQLNLAQLLANICGEAGAPTLDLDVGGGQRGLMRDLEVGVLWPRFTPPPVPSSVFASSLLYLRDGACGLTYSVAWPLAPDGRPTCVYSDVAGPPPENVLELRIFDALGVQVRDLCPLAVHVEWSFEGWDETPPPTVVWDMFAAEDGTFRIPFCVKAETESANHLVRAPKVKTPTTVKGNNCGAGAAKGFDNGSGKRRVSISSVRVFGMAVGADTVVFQSNGMAVRFFAQDLLTALAQPASVANRLAMATGGCVGGESRWAHIVSSPRVAIAFMATIAKRPDPWSKLPNSRVIAVLIKILDEWKGGNPPPAVCIHWCTTVGNWWRVVDAPEDDHVLPQVAKFMATHADNPKVQTAARAFLKTMSPVRQRAHLGNAVLRGMWVEMVALVLQPTAVPPGPDLDHLRVVSVDVLSLFTTCCGGPFETATLLNMLFDAMDTHIASVTLQSQLCRTFELFLTFRVQSPPSVLERLVTEGLPRAYAAMEAHCSPSEHAASLQVSALQIVRMLWDVDPGVVLDTGAVARILAVMKAFAATPCVVATACDTLLDFVTQCDTGVTDRLDEVFIASDIISVLLQTAETPPIPNLVEKELVGYVGRATLSLWPETPAVDAFKLLGAIAAWTMTFNDTEPRVSVEALTRVCRIMLQADTGVEYRDSACAFLHSLARHRSQRGPMLAAGVLDVFYGILNSHRQWTTNRICACRALYELAADEDCRAAICSGQGVKHLTDALKNVECPDSPHGQRNICLTLTRLATNGVSAAAIIGADALVGVFRAMEGVVGVSVVACRALYSLASTGPENLAAIVAAGGLPRVVLLLHVNESIGMLQEVACEFLSYAATTSVEYAVAVREAGALPLLFTVMDRFIAFAAIQQHGCRIIGLVGNTIPVPSVQRLTAAANAHAGNPNVVHAASEAMGRLGATRTPPAT